MLPTIIRNKVLFRTEDSSGAVSIVEDTMPAGAPGPPLHRHGFDEAFDVLDGELTFRVRDQLSKAHAGELIFAPRGVPHTLANLTNTPARFLLVTTPAGFEREFGGVTSAAGLHRAGLENATAPLRTAAGSTK